MAVPPAETDGNRFVTAVLPRWVAVVAFFVYLSGLSHWFSLDGLSLFARASGWSWPPELGEPLTRAVLFPFLSLPASWIPVALNIFNAGCAATALGLLARTVALLPQDILPVQPFRQRQPLAILSIPAAWIPPVLASIVCGLQLSFWEQATAMTDQMLDLLIFAWIILCLLEFRHNQQEKWLLAAATAAGGSMANNWVMIAYFPVFLVAIIGVKGPGILDPRFLLRMGLCGLAGLSLYLLLPFVQIVFAHADGSFWKLLKAHLQAQHAALSVLRGPRFRMIGLASLLPFGLLAIRWRSHTIQLADDSRFGVRLRRATGHAVHGLFFVCCLWLAFDPDFSPRTWAPRLPALTSYYSAALVFGYCAGYLLLFALHRPKTLPGRINLAGAHALVVIVPILLSWRNFGDIRAANCSALREFARQLYSDLPPGKSVVLSDDPVDFLLLRAEASSHRGEKEPLLLETGFLNSALYQAAKAHELPGRWPMGPPTNRGDFIGPARVLNLISTFATREPVLYAHPAFGLFFERFTDEPRGLAYALVPRPPQEAATSVISENVAATGEQLWQARWKSLQLQPSPPELKAGSGLARLLRLPPRPNFTLSFMSRAYSKCMDDWGVQLQRVGREAEAAVWFQRALRLNRYNLAAKLNLDFNEACRRGNKSRLDPAIVQRQLGDLFTRYKEWREVMINDGPVDEPTYLFRTGRILLQSGNNRQAAGAFARSMELAPEWPQPKLLLAESCIELRNFQSALRLCDQLDALAPGPEVVPPAKILFCRASALQGLGRTNDAIACINDFVARLQGNTDALCVAADLYAESGAFESELNLLSQLPKTDANQPRFLARQALAQLQLANYDAAASTLTKVLELNPKDQDARLSRAIAQLAADRLEAASADYQLVLKYDTNCADALFGLGTIAWREHDTNRAGRLYAQYLVLAKPKSAQYAVALERLNQIQAR